MVNLRASSLSRGRGSRGLSAAIVATLTYSTLGRMHEVLSPNSQLGEGNRGNERLTSSLHEYRSAVDRTPVLMRFVGHHRYFDYIDWDRASATSVLEGSKFGTYWGTILSRTRIPLSHSRRNGFQIPPGRHWGSHTTTCNREGVNPIRIQTESGDERELCVIVHTQLGCGEDPCPKRCRYHCPVKPLDSVDLVYRTCMMPQGSRRAERLHPHLELGSSPISAHSNEGHVRGVLTRSAGFAMAAPIIPLISPPPSLTPKLSLSPQGTVRRTIVLLKSYMPILMPEYDASRMSDLAEPGVSSSFVRLGGRLTPRDPCRWTGHPQS